MLFCSLIQSFDIAEIETRPGSLSLVIPAALGGFSSGAWVLLLAGSGVLGSAGGGEQAPLSQHPRLSLG